LRFPPGSQLGFHEDLGRFVEFLVLTDGSPDATASSVQQAARPCRISVSTRASVALTAWIRYRTGIVAEAD